MNREQGTPKRNKILSDAVERTKPKAEELLRQPEKAERLLSQAVEKADKREERKGPLLEVWKYLRALFRLMRSYLKREYTSIPWGSMALVVIAVIYFVALVDVLPDFVPGVGYIDDAAVIAFVVSQIRVDLDAFLRWESARGGKAE
ncbi:MAG: DUF1232 domain-containing protein [Anaerolineales bacterium]|nr:DUF1232 domain-containing protein [Anaerolineales bacterium]